MLLEEEDEGLLSTREVYRLLRAAPTMTKSLRLAARLRRAAREGRSLKDGRSIAVDSVDKAMDALLEKVERERAARRMEQEAEFEQPPQYRRQPAYEEQPEDPPPGVEWQPAPGFEDEQAAQEEERRRPQPELLPEASAERVQQARPTIASKVPEEVRKAVINSKYNYVDRVWRSPESGNLPKAPSRHEDNSLPEDSWLRLPHIAVNGMTNTGKSTLINHCLHWSYAAKASSRPGRTESIDFYVVNGSFVLVDLPGYPDMDEVAYMGVARNWESHWEDLVLTYLEMCAAGNYDLRLLLQLQMSKRRPSRMCARFAAEAKRLDLPSLLVMTKDDQLAGHEERCYWLTQNKKSLRIEGPHLHYTADPDAKSGHKARKHLHRWIHSAVTCGSTEEAKGLLQRVAAGKGFKG